MDLKISFPKKKSTLVGIAMYISALYPLFAQETSDSTERTILLETVTVSASRSDAKMEDIPSSVQLIHKKQFQGAQATISLDESFRNVPGIFVNNRYNFSQGERISIRGIGSRSQFGVRGVKMILDGIPLTFPDGITQLNNIDISSLGKAEVLKGASSVLYGNSSGGIIYLTTEEASKEKVLLVPSFIYGSYGLQKASMKTSGTLGKFDYLINSNRTSYKGYRQFSQSLTQNFNSKFSYHFSPTSSLFLIVNGTNSPYLLSPGALDKQTAEEAPASSRLFNQLQGSGKVARQLQSGLGYQINFSKDNTVNLIGYGVLRELFNPIPGRIVNLERKSGGLRATYNSKFYFRSSNLSFTTGFDWEHQQDQRKELDNNGITEEQLALLDKKDILKKVNKGPLILAQQESISANGLFFKLDWNYKKLSTSAGGRFDHYVFKVKDQFFDDNTDNSGSKIFQQFNPSIGLVYHFSRALNIYTNYSSSFQTPAANEFGNLPSGIGGFNPQLKPEKVKNYELGIRGNLWKNIISYDFVTFYLDILNQLIGYQTANTNSDEGYYRNAGKTRNAGLEANISIHPLKSLTIDLTYALNNFRFVNYIVETNGTNYQLKDKRVPGVPLNRWMAALKYYSPKGVSVELYFQQVDQYYANDFNGPVSGGNQDDFMNNAYSLLDLRISYEKKFKRFTPKFFGGINNLLNQRYNSSIIPNATGNRFFEPAPGINWYMGTSIPFVVLSGK